RLLREVGVGELLDGPIEVARVVALEVQRVLGNRRPLGEISLALPGLQRDVALPGQVRGILETAGALEHDRRVWHGSVTVGRSSDPVNATRHHAPAAIGEAE